MIRKPEDFFDSFVAYVRNNLNTIAAIKAVVQRPRDLTRADLRELRTALDPKDYSEANLRRAWADAKNEDIAASVIGFVRQGEVCPRRRQLSPEAVITVPFGTMVQVM
jgi:type I restriction enzyme R subunit